MTMQLQIKFDPNQDYQLEAVASVVDLFAALPQRTVAGSLDSEIVPNLPPAETLHAAWLRDNLRAVQKRNGIPPTLTGLEMDDGTILEGVGDAAWRSPHFTIEMETGTGKTYVYLRTIYELRKRYGFRKFIIVVPSVAIYEGVMKTFAITRDHFRALYGNEPVGLTRYDGNQISRLRAFASSTFLEIMVITLDSFNKAKNNLYKVSEKLPGERMPYQFLQETRPILILDEPQNMESTRAKEALRTLHPLFALRYSATHRTNPNLVYRLTPFDAYRRNLVKKIQVLGVTEHDNFNRPSLQLQAIRRSSSLTAQVLTHVTDGQRTRERAVTLKHGDDLYAKTQREEHRDGYVVSEINAGTSFVQFANGMRLALNDTPGPARVAIFREQITRTIEQHIAMQEQLFCHGVKVLSLFFLDRVANYLDEQGVIRQLFDEAFERLKGRSAHFAHLRAEQVRAGYFAQSRAKSGATVAIDTTSKNARERAAEKAAFALIMQQKEQLLSFAEPVSFIFAHSALKEGWDNPNVFQICTLNQTVSEMKKRQEIGRGMRLCVNQYGERLAGDAVNLLTVVANQSYRSYAEGLQREYAEDEDAPPPPPSDARTQWAVRNETIFAQNTAFRAFWAKLAQRVTYRIVIDTPALVAACAQRLNRATFPVPQIVVEQGRLSLHAPREFPQEQGQRPGERVAGAATTNYPVFDLLERAARETGLTRPTINAIFKGMRCEQKTLLLRNPEGFAGVFIAEVSTALADHVAERIEFVIDAGVPPYALDTLFPERVRFPQKTLLAAGERGLYDQVQCDSPVESRFVERLKGDAKVLCYFRFPPAFALHFPRLIGSYTPDWGIARYDDTGQVVLYIAGAARGTTGQSRRQILCAQKYFATLGIHYHSVTDTMAAGWSSEEEAEVSGELDLG